MVEELGEAFFSAMVSIIEPAGCTMIDGEGVEDDNGEGNMKVGRGA